MPTFDRAELDQALGQARARLLSQRVPAAHWEGELSSSALSTATALIALELLRRAEPGAVEAHVLHAGWRWLATHGNADGGFGDTVDSPSHLATSALAWTALGLAPRAGQDGGHGGTAETEAIRTAHGRAEGFLTARLGTLDGPHLAAELKRMYGDDHTFAVPILTACALGGALAEDPSPWESIPALPFELAALPRGLFRRLGLPVVSYALPALIAIGQVLHRRAPSASRALRLLRERSAARTLRVLEGVQPEGGGFLEATPLTSFVVMSLLGAGAASGDGPGRRVLRRGVEFLLHSARPDGAWPIDTNLATWVTTLSIGALCPPGPGAGQVEAHLDSDVAAQLGRWLLEQQLSRVHPFTGAAPGGWAWTDLDGGVPDADDTAGALLALDALGEPALPREEGLASARAGIRWLLDLQNRDGGMPTFCRGWTKLPFDQSCPDLTAHALRAFGVWGGRLEGRLAARARRARGRALRYLVESQRDDGAWVPLWFGNQAESRQENPVYGTSRVLRAAAVGVPEVASDSPVEHAWHRAVARGLGWLLAAQNSDGGFGGSRGLPSTIEESALALEALADALAAGVVPGGSRRIAHAAVERAVGWLIRATEGGRRFAPRPIGLYFAKLWYSARLYPMVFTVSALGRARYVLAEADA